MKELDSVRPQLVDFVKDTAEKMGESSVCLSIFTSDYTKSIDSMLQFSIAVMLDKPILLLVPEGNPIPKKVKQIADGIEYYKLGDRKSLEKATKTLFLKAREQGFAV